MSDDSSVQPPAPTFSDRIRLRIDQVQGWAQGIHEKVPPRVRRGLQRAFSITVFAVIAFALYRQLRGTDWAAVFQSIAQVAVVLRPVPDSLHESADHRHALLFGRVYHKPFPLLRHLPAQVPPQHGGRRMRVERCASSAIRTAGIGYRRAFSAIKDVCYLPAVASNAVAVVVLGAYFAFGDLSLTDSISRGAMTVVIAVILGAATLSLLLIAFRGKVLAVSTPVMWRIIGYHVIRSGGDLVLLGFQWTVGLPGTTFGDWVNLLIVAVLVTRVPGVPAKDFLFLSLALAFGDTVDADRTAVTALFLTDTALRQVAFVLSFVTGALWRSRPHPIPLDQPDDDEAGPEPDERVG